MIASLDHFVLTVRNIERSVAFYVGVLGMREAEFGDRRKALVFGHQKINFHLMGSEIPPHAHSPGPGTADLCFLLSVPLEEAMRRLSEAGIPIELGPVARTGAAGPIRSVYVRDPDANLIELSVSGPKEK